MAERGIIMATTILLSHDMGTTHKVCIIERETEQAGTDRVRVTWEVSISDLKRYGLGGSCVVMEVGSHADAYDLFASIVGKSVGLYSTKM